MRLSRESACIVSFIELLGTSSCSAVAALAAAAVLWGARIQKPQRACHWVQVEPFSVQHAYEGTFNEATPELTTCNPGSMKFVTNKEPKQEVAEGKEVIFSYDVLFLVSGCPLRKCAALHCGPSATCRPSSQSE